MGASVFPVSVVVPAAGLDVLFFVGTGAASTGVSPGTGAFAWPAGKLAGAAGFLQ